MDDFFFAPEMMAFAVPYDEVPTLPPEGARAALGSAVGLAISAIAASVWSKTVNQTWNFNADADRRRRWGLAGVTLVAATAGASIAARRGTKRSAGIGAALGTMLGQVPVIWDPSIANTHPVLTNVWQYGMPVAGALLGVNVTR